MTGPDANASPRRTASDAAPAPVVRAFACPGCGAAITPRAEGWAVTIACAACGAVLDALDPHRRILQEHARRAHVTPDIPLGTRGRLDGVPHAVVGYQRVTITVEGTDFTWAEYTCFNPYHGFRWLTEYDGHWNVVEKLRTPVAADGRATVMHDGRAFRPFQRAVARTTYAIGEFPWELRVGDEVEVHDYVAPPFLLSSEGHGTERTWSLGRYTAPAEVARLFGLPALDRPARGVFANQPNPAVRAARGVRRSWWYLTLAWAAVLLVTFVLSARRTVLDAAGTFARFAPETNATVLGPFALDGRTANVRVTLRSDVTNDWLWFGLSLIDEATGAARDFSAQTSYYAGRDADGAWTEGSRTDAVTIGEVPAGRYLLRVAPEGEPEGRGTLTYQVRVERDVPSLTLFLLAFAALTVPMLLAWWPVIGFEQRRWAESDSGAPPITALTP
jgi:hypothetical protein